MTSLPSPKAAQPTTPQGGAEETNVGGLSVLPPTTVPPSASIPPSPSKSSKRVLDADRRKADAMSAEVLRAQSLASARWSDCLLCLSSSLPLLQDNPYLLILQPPFLYDYLDSLTETLANLSSHGSDLQHVRSLLQRVYKSFIQLGKFAKYQPAFYFDDPPSIARFIRLMEQVSHRASDKALYPNILSLLTPTFSRTDLYPMLQQHHILRCLLSFAHNSWTPNAVTGAMLLAIIEEMTADAAMRAAIQQEAGWERLCKLCWGREHGLSRELQQRGQQALQWAEADMPEEWRMGSDEDDDAADDMDDGNNISNGGAGGGSMDDGCDEQLGGSTDEPTPTSDASSRLGEANARPEMSANEIAAVM